MDDRHVSFRWKDYAHGGGWRTMTLLAVEFLRRFLLHVLPSGFQRIRHYSFWANCHRQRKLDVCRRLLQQQQEQAAPPPPTPRKNVACRTVCLFALGSLASLTLP